MVFVVVWLIFLLVGVVCCYFCLCVCVGLWLGVIVLGVDADAAVDIFLGFLRGYFILFSFFLSFFFFFFC